MAHYRPQDWQQHFPAVGGVYDLFTDGAYWIVKNVPIQGDLYDIRIRVKDAEGRVIPLTDQDRVHVSTIQKITTCVQSLFQDMESEGIPKYKFCYNNLNQAPKCVIESLEDDTEVHEETDPQILSSAAQLHSVFFGDRGIGAAEECDLITPKYQRPFEGFSEIVPRYLPAPSPLRRNPEPAERVVPVESLSTTPIQPNPLNPPQVPVTSQFLQEENTFEEEESVQKIQEKVLEEAFNSVTPPGEYPNLNYSSFKKYAQTGEPNHQVYQKAYISFMNLCRNPYSQDLNDRNLLNWLSELYQKGIETVYNHEKDWESLYDAEVQNKNESMAIEGWLRDQVARQLISFIQVNNIDTANLIEAIKLKKLIDSSNSHIY